MKDIGSCILILFLLLHFSPVSAETPFSIEQQTNDTELLNLHKESFRLSEVSFSIEIIELNAAQLALCFSHNTIVGEMTKCFTILETGNYDFTQDLVEAREKDQVDAINRIYITLNDVEGASASGSYSLTILSRSFAVGAQTGWIVLLSSIVFVSGVRRRY